MSNQVYEGHLYTMREDTPTQKLKKGIRFIKYGVTKIEQAETQMLFGKNAADNQRDASVILGEDK